MNIMMDSRWEGQHGIGRFAHETGGRISPHFSVSGLPLLHPLEGLWLSWKVWQARPDVYFSPGFNPPLFCPVPLVFTIHDLIHLRVPGEGGGFKARLRTLYYQFMLRPAARRAARVLTVSEYSRRQIVAWAGLDPERVVVVGNGVDAAFSPHGARHRPGFRYLLYFWNGKPHKNALRLLQAFAGLADTQVRLLVSSAPDDELRHQALRLGVHDRVVFAGGIPEAELPAYYRGAEALAFPSLYEGFGLPALEALACGTPVVTSKITSLPEVVGDAAVLVDPYDPASITQGLQRVLDDPDLRARLSAAGPERARCFSWATTAARVQEALAGAAR
jgi:glycosyltransferase involved in cell wall biosynthesis